MKEGTGVYILIFTQTNCFLVLEPPKLLPLSFGTSVMNEGEFAQVSCIVRQGDQPLTISWSFHGSNITSELGITTMPTGPMGSLLMIPLVGHRHRGTYTCKASNIAGVRSQSVDLNVNGRDQFSGGRWKYIIHPLPSPINLNFPFHFRTTGNVTPLVWRRSNE